jgi:hypothetical protein
MSDAQVIQALQRAGIQSYGDQFQPAGIQSASGQLQPAGIQSPAPTAGTRGHVINELEELIITEGKKQLARLAIRVNELVKLEDELYGGVRPGTSRLAAGKVSLPENSAYINNRLRKLRALVPGKWDLYQTNLKEWVLHMLDRPKPHLLYERSDTRPVSQYYQLRRLLYFIAKDPAFLIIEDHAQKLATQAHFFEEVQGDWLLSTAPGTYESQVSPLAYRDSLASTYRKIRGNLPPPKTSWEEYTMVVWRVLGADTDQSDLPHPEWTAPLQAGERKESLFELAKRYWRLGETTLADRQLLQAAAEKLQNLFSEKQNPMLLQEHLWVILHGLHEFLGKSAHRYQQRAVYYVSLERDLLPRLLNVQHWTQQVVGDFLNGIEYQTGRDRYAQMVGDLEKEHSVSNRRVPTIRRPRSCR